MQLTSSSQRHSVRDDHVMTKLSSCNRARQHRCIIEFGRTMGKLIAFSIIVLLQVTTVRSELLNDERSTPSEDSRCSYTFKLPASECSRTPAEDKLLKSSVIALQAQFKLLASKLTEEDEKLRQKIATIEAGAVGGSGRSAVNLKQCSKRGLNYDKENGLAYSCEFVKKRDDTVLRVVFNGDLRLIHKGNKYASCRRWFFTINGQECMEGYCRGVAAGDVRVAWNIGDCVNGEGWDQSNYNTGDSYAGWVATVRIIVEEVGVEDADNAIV
ncbi:hypothetical protein LSAT2_023251 [Lamellibrachia satsuma]|nr:hypothetical protein LSAT2_023251 [Lamellibrachia satsuma]